MPVNAPLSTNGSVPSPTLFGRSGAADWRGRCGGCGRLSQPSPLDRSITPETRTLLVRGVLPHRPVTGDAERDPDDDRDREDGECAPDVNAVA